MTQEWNKGSIRVRTYPMPVQNSSEEITVLEVRDASAIKPKSRGFGAAKSDPLPFKLYGLTTRDRRILLMESNHLETVDRTAADLAPPDKRLLAREIAS